MQVPALHGLRDQKAAHEQEDERMRIGCSRRADGLNIQERKGNKRHEGRSGERQSLERPPAGHEGSDRENVPRGGRHALRRTNGDKHEEGSNTAKKTQAPVMRRRRPGCSSGGQMAVADYVGLSGRTRLAGGCVVIRHRAPRFGLSAY